MGAFVLGILVGWLAEWLFFTFWVNGKSTDCTVLKTELSSKNAEIASLKADLENTKKIATESISTEATNKAENKGATKTVSTTTAKSITENKTAKSAAKKAPKKPVAKKATPKKASATKATAKKVPATKTTPKKPVAKKTAPKKASATKTTVKKAPVAKASPKKPTAKKAPATKATPKKPAVMKAPAKKITSGDDLTKLSGIGPSIAATLSELGITSYKKLADMDDDILRDMLEASGARLNNNKEAMDTWNEQAELADKGDFDGLKKLQESLKK